eukprot:3230232-Karenia_brevis.AAC.1
MPVLCDPVPRDHFECDPSAISPLKGKSEEHQCQLTDSQPSVDVRSEDISYPESGGLKLIQVQESWFRGRNGKFIAISEAPTMETVGVRDYGGIRSSESSGE